MFSESPEVSYRIADEAKLWLCRGAKWRRPEAAGDGSDERYISVITSSTSVTVIIRAFVMIQECVANTRISTFTLQFLYKQISRNSYGVTNHYRSVEQGVSVKM